MDLNYKFSKHLSTRMRSNRTGPKAQKKRKSAEAREEAGLCGWAVERDLAWDHDGIGDLMFPSGEHAHEFPERRCPLLVAMESEQSEFKNRMQDDSKEILEHNRIKLPGPRKETSKKSSPSTGGGEGNRGAETEGEWGVKCIARTIARLDDESASPPAEADPAEVTEHRESTDKSVSGNSKKSKGTSAIERKTSNKSCESRGGFTFPPPVAAVIYSHKKLECDLRETMAKCSRNARSGKEAKPKEKKVVNPALISCPSETNLKLDSFCSESMPPRGEGTVRGKVSELKLPRVTTSRKGLTCNGRGGDIKNGTESYDDNALSCQVREPNGHDYRTSFNEEKRDSTQGRSSPRRMTLKKSSFEFDVLEQYSVIRKTSREGFSQSSAVEQISNQHDNCDVTIPLEPSGSTELKDSGSSSTIKFPPLEAAACAQDTRTFHAVRALWCVLQRERLVVHVTQSAHDLSRGSRTLANDMILRNRACSERGRGIHKEDSLPQGFRASKSQCPLQRIRDVTNKRLELQEDCGSFFPETVGKKIKCGKGGVLAPVKSAGVLPFDCFYPKWRDSEGLGEVCEDSNLAFD